MRRYPEDFGQIGDDTPRHSLLPEPDGLLSDTPVTSGDHAVMENLTRRKILRFHIGSAGHALFDVFSGGFRQDGPLRWVLSRDPRLPGLSLTLPSVREFTALLRLLAIDEASVLIIAVFHKGQQNDNTNFIAGRTP